MKKNKHLNHTSPKMDKDESTKELNCIALVLVAQKEYMLLMHETLLLANLDI
jgi:alkylhydroperoxidase/carboxymuconolactone decarboxylase family protein YurZ